VVTKAASLLAPSCSSTAALNKSESDFEVAPWSTYHSPAKVIHSRQS
jgi:hypothetical protein